ncbi:hypothetical protein O3P69_007635 [Scylla paramamosain]|uniref:Uncharacterized protein n=1 Tax=Scylla paramamosain TaxID=85552 RepID=A0AAW0UWL4_SCYPA
MLFCPSKCLRDDVLYKGDSNKGWSSNVMHSRVQHKAAVVTDAFPHFSVFHQSSAARCTCCSRCQTSGCSFVLLRLWICTARMGVSHTETHPCWQSLHNVCQPPLCISTTSYWMSNATLIPPLVYHYFELQVG